MPLKKVARVEEIPPGRTKFVSVDEQPIVLANREGRIYALSGLCGHQQKPLDGAVLWDYLLDCPWHHFQYDIRTGENHFPRNVYPPDLLRLQDQVKPLTTYPVKIENGDVWVDL